MPESGSTVSAVLLCYNCESFVAEAVRSALGQDHRQAIEIVISDDASTDRTAEIVEREVEAYRGPHSIRLLRHATNSGSKSAHLNRVVSATSGHLLVSFDGDDVSRPWRVRKLVDRFRLDPEIQAVYSDYTLMDGSGRTLGPGRVPHPDPGTNSREWFVRVDAYAAGGTLAVRRPVFEVFGPLDPAIHEDIVLPFRASLLGETVFIDEALVRARRHATSFTADMDRFSSLAAYRSRMLDGIDRARRHLDSRLEDIAAAQALMPERADALGALRPIAYQSLGIAELSGQLLSPSRRARLSALLRLTRAGAYREHFLQHAALVVAPELYLRYKRRSGIAGSATP